MKNIIRKIITNPYTTAVLALMIGVLLAIIGDLFLNSVTFWNVGWMVGFSIVGSFVLACVLFVTIKKSRKKYSTKAIIIIIAVAVAVFNISWITSTLVIKSLEWNLWLGGQIALIIDIFVFLMLGVVLFFNLFGRRPAFIVFTAIACLISIVALTLWVGNPKSLSYASFNTNMSEEATGNNSWSLDGVPKYDGGKYSRVYNSGTMLAYDYLPDPTGEETYMQVVTNTSEAEYNAYLQKLANEGYNKTYENKIEDNLFAGFRKNDDYMIYTYYTAYKNEVRVIKDVVSTDLDNFSYEAKKQTNAEVFQYALLYDDDFYEYGGAIEQCGMLYVIKLNDNSVVIIDGGMSTQSSDSAVDGFMEFLKDKLGTPNGEKIRIACWYGSHAHSDHFSFFAKFLVRFEGQYTLERYMFNYPSSREDIDDCGSTALFTLQQRIKKYCPDAKALKLHTGMEMSFAGTKIEVLYTHEDGFNGSTGLTDITNFNDTCTVIKVNFDGHDCLFLADTDKVITNRITNMYTNQTLDTELLQIAHHGMNGEEKLYSAIKADILMIPQSEKNAKYSNKSCQRIEKILDKCYPTQKRYYAREYTYGFSDDGNGNLVLSTEIPYVGEEQYYDGSLM